MAARVLHVAGWLVVVPLLLMAAARLVAWDARASLVVANALTPMLYLPAWLVAVTRIDHVLTNRGLAVTRIAVGTGPGSDHRPLVADVAVL